MKPLRTVAPLASLLASLLVSLLIVQFGPACATAHAADASTPSQVVGDISGVVVAGSLLPVVAAGSIVVVAVDRTAEGIDLLLNGVANGSRATVRLSGKAAEGLSVAAGTAVEVSAVATGHLLILSGKAIAFIPNEAGKALLHSERISG